MIPFKTKQDNLFSVVYGLCNIRGSETIVKMFPHDVEDLEYLVDILEHIELVPAQWYVKYVLLLWLSIIVMAPFDLESIDTKKGDVSLL